MGGRTLDRAKVSSNLLAAYRCLGLDAEAREWQQFLDRIACPAATKDAMSRRSEVTVRRWNAEARLLLV